MFGRTEGVMTLLWLFVLLWAVSPAQDSAAATATGKSF